MNHYELLGVDRHASPDIIKAAYRVQAKKYHPDLTANDPRSQLQMQRVNEAYAVLSDPQKRRNYDLSLPENDYEEPRSYSRPAPPVQEEEYEYEPAPPRRRRSSGGKGMIAALVLLAIALTVGLFYLFFAMARYSLFG